MKHVSIAALLSLACAGLAAAADEAKPAAGAALDTPRAKTSYSLGFNLGKQLKDQQVDVDLDAFMKGIAHALAGEKKTLLTEAEMRQVMMTFQKDAMSRQSERTKTAGDKNRKEGEAFLAENKGKPGVQTLPSGLQYKVLKEGTGPKPKATDKVRCHYRGTLIDGTEFDSSYERGEPAEFPLTGVIRGWTEALQLMGEGAKWQLFIPSDLAYGPRGRDKIPPSATLIFEVELIKIQ